MLVFAIKGIKESVAGFGKKKKVKVLLGFPWVSSFAWGTILTNNWCLFDFRCLSVCICFFGFESQSRNARFHLGFFVIDDFLFWKKLVFDGEFPWEGLPFPRWVLDFVGVCWDILRKSVLMVKGEVFLRWGCLKILIFSDWFVEMGEVLALFPFSHGRMVLRELEWCVFMYYWNGDTWIGRFVYPQAFIGGFCWKLKIYQWMELDLTSQRRKWPNNFHFSFIQWNSKNIQKMYEQLQTLN